MVRLPELDGFQLRGASTHSTPVAPCSWPRRRAAARRSSPSTPIEPARPELTGAGRSTRRPSRPCRTRSTTTSCARHGAHQVGLLTGDNAINGDAPVVVMTTEVLRNMIYAGQLGASICLAVVVLDEVHFLQDTYRGPGLGGGDHPPRSGERVRLVCLSATVSERTAELADWMTTVRGPTDGRGRGLRRPVRLETALRGGRPDPRSACTCCRRSSPTGPNPEATRLDGEAARCGRRVARRAPAHPGASAAPVHAQSRLDVVERAPAPTGHAPGDLLHLQPQPVRRRRPDGHASNGASG